MKTVNVIRSSNIIKEIALATGIEIEEVIALNLTENDLRNYETESERRGPGI